MNDRNQMLPAPDSTRKTVEELIEKFNRNREAYHNPQYKEDQCRIEFINPFFEALGWDIANKQGFAEQYKEVIHEETLDISGQTKAPDYSFRIGGIRKFFLEAKRPAVNIKSDPSPSYQLRRYAWSAKLSLSVLTDFGEFAVYDCRIRPDEKDKADAARVQYLTFEQYPSEINRIYSTFSKEAVLKGSFDRFIESARGKRGTSEVDSEFLKEIEHWREILAKNIALRNPQLNVHRLNDAVQRTIDRIIFLRMAEDRGIERYQQLEGITSGQNTYKRLCAIFYKSETKYNSGLFDFKKDSFSLELKIDDNVLAEIIQDLYYPKCSYEFSVIGAEILGNIYEQFLGKVIRLTPSHQAKVEEKPEVKKAGGVYYTPRYIVDYIVKNTVGKLLEGKAPKEISNLKILDPACGSGSFLLGAYQCLLDYHLKYYSENSPDKNSKDMKIYPGPRGGWLLTTKEKKRILLNNIFGVDIDPQAVEVTKLSLLLKVLENENEETLRKQLQLFHERALPDLDNNIKCGNSLIGQDFYKNQQIDMFDEEQKYKINAFDWEQEFKEIFQKGGFDVVIGNPPYIRIQALREWSPLEVDYYGKQYTASQKGNYDIYVIFVEKSLALLNQGGKLGFILPHKFFNAHYGELLRSLIAKGKHIEQIVHFGDQQIFVGATNYTCLLFLSKKSAQTFIFKKVDNIERWRLNEDSINGVISNIHLDGKNWNFTTGCEGVLLEKLKSLPIRLEDVTLRIFQGLKTGADKVFIVDVTQGNKTSIQIYSKQNDKSYKVEADLFHPLIKGGDSKRYWISPVNRKILFPYEETPGGAYTLIPEKDFRGLYPKTFSYLIDHKDYLEQREHGIMKGRRWYAYTRNQALDVISKRKLFTPDIGRHSSFSFDENGNMFFTGGVAGGYGILAKPELNQKYLLGLLNSKLLEWFIQKTATQMRGGYFSYESRFIKYVPIKVVNPTDPLETSSHDKIVSLVEHMIGLNNKLSSSKTPNEKVRLEREIKATDQEIDRLVYELYGLTEEEIKFIESG